ncbi:MAG: hypothetical protein ACT4PJ_08530 [Gemmatimonadaceae bacterium]
MRLARLSALAVAAAWTLACEGTIPGRAVLPDVIFVTGDEQDSELLLWTTDGVMRLTTNAFADEEPHVANDRLVFTSDRDGNREIYFGDLRATSVRRLTEHNATDGEAAMRPGADWVAFVSMRSGTPRIWVTDTVGSTPVMLETGSATFVPEHGPAWSPAGDRLAFTSARTGTSQVFIVDAAGGAAVQLTREAGGAFDPVWTASGSQVLYATGAGTPRLRIIPASGGAAADYAVAAAALGEPSCNQHFCVAVRGAYGPNGDLVAFGAPSGSTGGAEARILLERGENDRAPAAIP